MKTIQSQPKLQIKKELPVFYFSDHIRKIKANSEHRQGQGQKNP
jgi:hypothetical protein